jgi:phospholipid/cholesterol/gamma-HCH transport system permease protein
VQFRSHIWGRLSVSGIYRAWAGIRRAHLTGRISAKLAAELGTMRVTEQIDALTCLSLDPYPYLLTPRMVAGVIMLPVLTIFSSFVAIISAQLIAQIALGLDSAIFYQGLKWLFRIQDVVICLVKAFVLEAP